MSEKPETLYELGLKYGSGDGVERSDGKAFECFKASAEKGHAAAEYSLANCYFYASGTGEDPESAIFWYRKAASDGNTDAMFAMGQILYYGVSGDPDYPGAFGYFSEGAGRGHPKCLLVLGDLYKKGHGTGKSAWDAVRCYRAAADSGLSVAVGRLGWHSFAAADFSGYVPDVGTLIREATEGNAESQYILGMLHEFGNSVPHSFGEAVEWYRKASEAGSVPACFRLGVCLCNRAFAECDEDQSAVLLDEARNCLNKAEKAGHEEAIRCLDALESSLI